MFLAVRVLVLAVQKRHIESMGTRDKFKRLAGMKVNLLLFKSSCSLLAPFKGDSMTNEKTYQLY